MKYSHFLEHIDSCFKASVSCPLKCDEKIVRLDDFYGMDHFSKCSNGIIRCQNCDEYMTRGNLKDHSKTCGADLMMDKYKLNNRKDKGKTNSDLK